MLKRLTQVFKPTDFLDDYWSPIFENFPEMVLIVDQNLAVYQSNPVWQNFTGLTAMHGASAKLQLCSTFIYPEDLFQFQQRLAKPSVLERYRLRMMDAKGDLHWYEVSATPLPEPNLGEYWCLLCSDQTTKIKDEYLQFAQQRSLRDLLRRLPVMLYRSRNDRDWTMEYVSHACSTITGYSAKALLNTPLYGQIIHHDDAEHVWSQVQKSIQHKTMFHLEYRITRADQHIVQVQEIGQGLYSNSDMVLGVEGIIFAKQI